MLLSFGEDVGTSRKFYADGKYVGFALSCYLESAQLADRGPTAYARSRSTCWSAVTTC